MLILGLCAAALPWKPISWSSQQTLIVLMLLPEAVWNSVVSVATEARRFLLFFKKKGFYLLLLFLRASALCGPVLLCLALRGWAVVAPRLFHLTTTSITVDRGSSSRAETDLLGRWHLMIVPRWKSLSSSVQAILLPIFVYGDCMSVCSILYTCPHTCS